MRRGEIWWAGATPPPAAAPSRRMVLLLSWDADQRFRDRVTVAPITTTIRGLDAEVFLDHRDGVDRGCVVNLDIMATVLRSVLLRRVSQLGDAKMVEVERAVQLALGMRLPCACR